MKYGFVLPWGTARDAADLAAVAERHGWDGFFVWEPVWGVDAWVALGAAAMTTSRIRLGTLLTPLPRRRPWDLAGQVATVDGLSGGRVTLSVGLGALHGGWTAFERDQGRRTRAEQLDEGLDVLRGLLAGQPFTYAGTHYRVEPTDFMVPPPPVQRPHPPIWVVGAWPAPKSMRRAARADGWLPNVVPAGTEFTPALLAEGLAWIRALRQAEGLPLDGYDVTAEGVTPAGDPDAAREKVAPWAAAGATWWIEGDWSVARERVRGYAEERLAAGPPR
ncbi:LLM class flavin-dependent oxidoreductase [Spirilliplanes yamanashiensis]|uniref:Luciferase-like protein n=1 Tax=Spirilliplanes yamanashiensis TaxID=42233 RepID=A0A8J3Y7C2_9ACTN|nr:LLM class flavin-dependent oxidoreductase [Spirilliplanes yamanashiensis]MDP9814995.1 alkanesulfonate monooxygenase SsuD/methylene tetrahydromethanopterin reductase-like flavin-dependent oxidoreductase (luciferase family) [Spirilliplanes yamanashiensis]GIJ02650.1 luciferase-like protein [Spirilliplanes yamanashiensis]